jgi:hypothetical protein
VSARVIRSLLGEFTIASGGGLVRALVGGSRALPELASVQHKWGILAMVVHYGAGAGGEVEDGVRHMAFGLADGRCVRARCCPPRRFFASSLHATLNPRPDL